MMENKRFFYGVFMRGFRPTKSFKDYKVDKYENFEDKY
jgi:hypothetical protein